MFRWAYQIIIVLMIALIRFYRLALSSVLLPRCRFAPTCSEYAIDALKHHGIKGVFLTTKRILRCHPFHRGGYDPVPPTNKIN